MARNRFYWRIFKPSTRNTTNSLAPEWSGSVRESLPLTTFWKVFMFYIWICDEFMKDVESFSMLSILNDFFHGVKKMTSRSLA